MNFAAIENFKQPLTITKFAEICVNSLQKGSMQSPWILMHHYYNENNQDTIDAIAI